MYITNYRLPDIIMTENKTVPYYQYIPVCDYYSVRLLYKDNELGFQFCWRGSAKCGFIFLFQAALYCKVVQEIKLESWYGDSHTVIDLLCNRPTLWQYLGYWWNKSKANQFRSDIWDTDVMTVFSTFLTKFTSVCERAHDTWDTSQASIPLSL